MKIALLSTLFMCLSSFHPFEKDILAAVNFLRNEKKTVLEIKNSSYTVRKDSFGEGREALAIVFPEMIRWSAFRDFFETKSLETLYVLGGKSAADFSIGHFQMKPSFIENLEKYVSEHFALNHFNYIIPSQNNGEECRSERVKRLKQFKWQLRYAHVYWAVARDLFKNKIFKTPAERVHFFAAAYNYGFEKPLSDIEKWQNKVAFPYGVQYKGNQLVYANIAVEFLEKYAQEF